MKLYNSMTMQKEEFVPLVEGKVTMYACGPTVYDYIHIGNARPIIVFDALRRYFEYRGYEVTFVQNFTDIDDKIIRRANELGISSRELAEKFIEEYFVDAKGLGVREATVHPRATENIPQIIELIQTLMDKGLAYESGGDVYFRTERYDGYGKLSHQSLDDLLAGARVDVNEIKENPMNFALWKKAKPGEPSWPSPWGEGRPGWHIECSAMSSRYLGKTIDIHCGGQDLTFPHHENEIAQSEGASGQTFVRYWLHNGYINVDNRKMSKSLGNFFTVRDAAAAYGYENIRMFMLMSHYRSPLNYSGEALTHAKNALERLKQARKNLLFVKENGREGEIDEAGLDKKLEVYRSRYIEAMDDDFNTADAISVIFELVREANTLVSSGTMARREAERYLSLFDELTGVLGLLYAEKDADTELAEEVEALIAARQAARKAKNWAEADRIRDKLKEMGIILEDTPQGVRWRRA
ncbi:MAG: cysteine--tRNA ligase [Clostridiales bacterium]|nr:cysteine--tRNA ligase [Clostridiales bacterium]